MSNSVSQLSFDVAGSSSEDWDRSIYSNLESPSIATNSVAFPSGSRGDEEAGTPVINIGKSKRTLSELLKLHAQKGTDVNFTIEEADRVAEVLGQWINSSSSPYEAEDDFFTRSQDDSRIKSTRAASGLSLDSSGRPRGQSESVFRPAH